MVTFWWLIAVLEVINIVALTEFNRDHMAAVIDNLPARCFLDPSGDVFQSEWEGGKRPQKATRFDTSYSDLTANANAQLQKLNSTQQ